MSSVRLTRRVTFSSGHRFWDPERSPEDNRTRFGSIASPYNHGHNYVLEVSASGAVHPESGMVVNIKVIDDVLKERVIRRFDLKSLNDEVAPFDRAAPTLENLLEVLAADLAPNLPPEVCLDGLRLEEAPTLYAEWHPSAMITLTRVYEFSASHRLHAPALSHEENLRLFGKCNNPSGHGHNYVLEVTVTGEPDPLSGMLCSIEALDEAVERLIVQRYDHRNLNEDISEFEGVNPTSEVVAQTIFSRLEGNLPARLSRVRLLETARSIFEVTGSPSS